jgi:hypothetical protein
MRIVVRACLLIFLASSTGSGFAKVIVFWQEAFPTLARRPKETGSSPREKMFWTGAAGKLG